MTGPNGLTIRKTDRYEVALPARVRVAAEHRSTVRFAPSSGARDGWIDVDVADIAAGGVGVMTKVFLPRGVDLDLEIFGLDGQGSETLLACRARVQRSLMTDRRPAYFIGLAFVGHSPETVKRVNELLAMLDGDEELND